MKLCSVLAVVALWWTLILASVWGAWAEEPLIPEGCWKVCHGSPDAIWNYHTHDKPAVQVLRIAEGDCLYCHDREDLWQLYMQHYKSWYWYERAKQLEQREQRTFQLPELNPIVLISLVSWTLIIGLSWLTLRR